MMKVNCFWTLHYLKATGVRSVIGFNMCQEIIELLTNDLS